MGSGRTARQGNEINTARRLLKIGFAPADLLYSESLTKVIKVFEVKSEPHTGARPSVRLCVGLKTSQTADMEKKGRYSDGPNI